MDNQILEKIVKEMDSVESMKPFQIIYYGSREREEANEYSDYNFYLLASAADQIKTTFIQKINESLSTLEDNFPVTMIAGDIDSLMFRIKLFEPTAIHILELGRPIYGEKEFNKLKNEWQTEYKLKSVNIYKLTNYLESRVKFFRNLKAKNTKEDVNRIEKILCLNLQIWLINNIPDISVTELYFTDIPSRLVKLCKTLYKSEIPYELELLVSIYEEVHELKQTLRSTVPNGTNEYLNRLKVSIASINELSSAIAGK